jgi:hypothetical protein
MLPDPEASLRPTSAPLASVTLEELAQRARAIDQAEGIDPDDDGPDDEPDDDDLDDEDDEQSDDDHEVAPRDAGRLPPRVEAGVSPLSVAPEASPQARRRGLTQRQWLAIDLLVLGKTDDAVASGLHVARSTVTRWRLYHPAFIAELNRRRSELWTASADRFRSMFYEATELLRNELLTAPDGERRFRAAVAISRLVGAAKAVRPTGPMSADEIVDELIRARRRADGRWHVAGPITEEDRRAMLEELAAKLEDASSEPRDPEANEAGRTAGATHPATEHTPVQPIPAPGGDHAA